MTEEARRYHLWPEEFGWRGKVYEAILWRTRWTHLSFGFSIALEVPNVEIHLPFCFLRIGRQTSQSRWVRQDMARRGYGVVHLPPFLRPDPRRWFRKDASA